MQHNAARGKTAHNRRAMVQARGKPGQHASAEGVPAPAQELARAARQAGEPKRRVQGKQEGAGGEPAAVGTRERKQEGAKSVCVLQVVRKKSVNRKNDVQLL